MKVKSRFSFRLNLIDNETGEIVSSSECPLKVDGNGTTLGCHNAICELPMPGMCMKVAREEALGEAIITAGTVRDNRLKQIDSDADTARKNCIAVYETAIANARYRLGIRD